MTMDDPYRTPAKVMTDEERRAAWLREYESLGMLNAYGRPAAELEAIRKRRDELFRLLFPEPRPVPYNPEAVKALLKRLGWNLP